MVIIEIQTLMLIINLDLSSTLCVFVLTGECCSTLITSMTPQQSCSALFIPKDWFYLLLKSVYHLLSFTHSFVLLYLSSYKTSRFSYQIPECLMISDCCVIYFAWTHEKGCYLCLRGYCTPWPYFWRLCAFSRKIKQLRTKYSMDLVRNVPRNSKITVLL